MNRPEMIAEYVNTEMGCKALVLGHAGRLFDVLAIDIDSGLMITRVNGFATEAAARLYAAEILIC